MSIASIYDILQWNSEIEYIKCHDAMPFDYKQPFPLALNLDIQPYKGMFAQTFVLKIPNGKVCSQFGFVNVQGNIVAELLSQNYCLKTHKRMLAACDLPARNIKKIPGKVAVLTRIDTGVYGHWIADILGKLAILALHNIEYDWLYVPYDKAYIRETLTLMGVDPAKIIEPFGDAFYIQADELIVPSLTSRRIPGPDAINFIGHHPGSHVACPSPFYCAGWNMKFLRDTFLPLADQAVASDRFAQKIFISRKDANVRRMINEDEVFAIFQAQGFVRYSMTDLTILEQIALFNRAKVIVAGHGSSLIHLIFCNQEAHVVEIFQNQFDSGFWQLSQELGLRHDCLKTQEMQDAGWQMDTVVPLDVIRKYIETSIWK